jgi:conjugal transfer pilus assembly protein TraU
MRQTIWGNILIKLLTLRLQRGRKFIKISSKHISPFVVSFFLFCSLSMEAQAKKCTGEVVNPITDINWSCLFPITLGSIEIVGAKDGLQDTKNPSSPICVCPKKTLGGVPMPGIVGGFWEPARMVDVSSEPYCFVNMGGLQLDMGFSRNQGGRAKGASHQISNWYVHYYIYPVIYMLKIFKDFVCLDEEPDFDPLWITEIDPSGTDDDLSMILHPDAFLFNNLLAQTACSADCTKSTMFNQPMDSLYWCAGCQGSMFPMNGNVNAHIGGVQASLNATEKMTFKMHRQGMAHQTSSDSVSEICSKHLALIMKKSHYRYQMVNPDPSNCLPFGKSTTVFESRKEVPIVGEDFGYILWRKVSCCIF